MIFEEYRELTKRTCVDKNEVLLNSIHMSLGLGSEVEELYSAFEKHDYVNVSEELADGLWYAANYCNLYNIIPSQKPLKFVVETESADDKILEGLLVEYVKTISLIQDLDKKELAYGKEVEIDVRKKLISKYFEIVNLIYFAMDMDIEKSMENNINKLIVRFPDKFTEHLAKNRNLDAERVELSKGIDDKN